MARRVPTVLWKLPVEGFLRSHWQKEPLVIRGAFPDLHDPLTPDELAGLACAPHVDSRLVLERGGKKPWQVIRGPQKPARLQKLPRSHWTLLVESVDRHSEAIAAFASAFPFLPRWRMDDVMVSLSPNHGTVEAHIDSYDVFLIQGQGRRRWEVDRRARSDYRPGLDLRILKRFKAEDSWVLEPGDMLYVPPGVGHRGVTVRSKADIALTYSVGFRAPSTSDLLTAVLSRTLALETPILFSDPGRAAMADAGELSKPDLDRLRQFLLRRFDAADPDAWTLAAGEAVTSGGAGRGAMRVVGRSVVRRLEGGETVRPLPAARMAWSALDRGRAALFVNGESRVLSRAQAFVAPFLCGNLSQVSARRLASNPELISLVADLFRAGLIRWSE